MASPSYTYTLANSTTADADEVMQNFNDILNGVSDGSKDLSISALTVAGNANFNGNTTLGNATGDTITVTGRMASTVNPSASASYGLGSSALAWTGLYLDNGATDGGGVYFDAGSTKYLRSNAAGTELQIGGFTTLETGGAQQKEFGLYVEAKSADYTITDTDGVSGILMTTGASTQTVTLPTAADNTGRVIEFVKVDSGAGTFVIDGEGAETINGATTLTIEKQYSSVTLICNGSAWFSIGTPKATQTRAGIVSKEYYSDEADLSGTTSNFPTGTVSKRYQWSQIGNLVTLRWRVEGTTAATNSSIGFNLPGDCPTPITMSGGGSLEWIGAAGYAHVATAINGALLTTGTDIYNNAGTLQIISYPSAGSVATKYYAGCMTYLTTA